MSIEHEKITGYAFGEFLLDESDRQLWRGKERVALTGRSFDVLLLLVSEHRQLVEKDRLFGEVWRDVVVTDSALTQCIKEIRKKLGDRAADPRFIQTVPRHGYRFIAEVEYVAGTTSTPYPESKSASSKVSYKDRSPESDFASWRRDGLFEWGAGTLGGGAAGLLGGMLYGFGLASSDAGIGALSTLLVLVGLNVLVGLAGGFGISLGLAGAGLVARLAPSARLAVRIAGATLGGLIIGTLAKFLGVDAFNLLFGRAPAGITGGPEGAALGAALAFGALIGRFVGNHADRPGPWYTTLGAGFSGAIAGALIPIAGGRLMGGSLELLAASFSDSRLQFDSFSSLFGEIQFGLATQSVLGAVEGFLFGSCVVGALVAMVQLRRKGQDFWKI